MAQDLGLAFRLSADASGMTSGIARAEKSLQRVGKEARGTSRDFSEAARITESVRTPAEKYAQTVSRLDNLMEKGLVSQEVYARAVAKADAELGDAEGTLNSYGAAANKVESIVNRVSAAIHGVGDASGSIADSADKFVDLGSKIVKVSAVYATFRALTRKREGQGSIVTLALGFTKTIGVIKAAQFALNAFGVEAEGASRVAVAAAVGATALKAAAMAGWDAAGIKKYAAGIDETYKLSGLATKSMTMLGISASSQAKVFAGLGTAAEGSIGLITSATTLSVLSFANYAATAYMVAKAMFAAKGSIEATATSVRALSLEAAMAGKTFNDLQIEKALNAGAASEDILRLGLAIGALDRSHLDQLGASMEKSEKAAARYNAVWANIGTTLGSPLMGLFTAVRSGFNAITDGATDFGVGLLSLMQPIGQVLRPFGTLVGAAAEAVLRLVGGMMSAAGLVLRLAGAFASLSLAIPIVGFNSFADSIRGSVGPVFEWFGKKIEYVHKQLDSFFNYLANTPVLGAAFATNTKGPMQAVAPGRVDMNVADPAAAMAADAEAEKEFLDSITDSLDGQTTALAKAIDRAMQYGDVGMDAATKYQDGVASLNDQLERGAINETTYAREAEKLASAFDDQLNAVDALAEARAKLAEQDMEDERSGTDAITRATNAYFEATKAAEKYGAAGAAASAEYEGGLTSLSQKLEDGRINQTVYAQEAAKLGEKFRGQIDGMKVAADAERRLDDAKLRRANDIEKMQGRVDDAGAFQGEASKAIDTPESKALEVSDVRSSEGIASFMALATGREDPAIAEYRKSHQTLQSMLAELKALQAAPLEIAGGAGG
jgi:hypothetical protein